MKIEEGAKYELHAELIKKFKDRCLVEFTIAQCAALDAGLICGNNLFISAPTSGGKTTIAEIAAVQTALQGKKTVYLLSHKALAEEKYKLFSELYANSDDNWFDVSIATGDRVEGKWNSGVLVATYEKFLALSSTSDIYQFDNILVVVDEIQLLNDETRGADVEILCTKIKMAQPAQIIALSATVNNSNQIAQWLDLENVRVVERDVPLYQQVWYQGSCYECNFGETNIKNLDGNFPTNTIEACRYLLGKDLGPILVFTMTRRKAVELAEELSQNFQRDTTGFNFSDQLDLFSEPLTLSTTLKAVSEKRVVFHTADLSLDEREIIEQNLAKKLFDVVFATPTLAAGVNFPFQTVVFDSFHRFWISDNPWLPKDEYQNMSGRAGRLGMHEKGYAVLLPTSRAEQIQSNQLISPDQIDVHSKLTKRSLRKLVLNIISGSIQTNKKKLDSFFMNTYWWHEQQESNPAKLKQLLDVVSKAIVWLLENGFVTINEEDVLCATEFGLATSRTGLLPSTVKKVTDVISQNRKSIENGTDQYLTGLIHLICASDEFSERGGQRTLPYSERNTPSSAAASFLRNSSLFLNINSTDFPDQVQNATFAIILWINGHSEKQLNHAIPPISYGHMQRLSDNIAWVLSGINTVLSIPSLGIPEKFLANLSIIIERIQYGVPTELVDIMKIAKSALVPGFGRHRAMKLLEAGFQDPNQLHTIDKALLYRILDNEERSTSLLNAVASYLEMPLRRWKSEHVRKAAELELNSEIIEHSYEATGNEYEDHVENILSLVDEWTVHKLDKAKRQGVPDFQIEFEENVVLIECKTKQAEGALISKDAAFSILTKGADIKCNSYLTIGKPDFDTFSKQKAGGTPNVSLVSHPTLIEAIIKYRGGHINAKLLYEWLTSAGYKEIENLELFIRLNIE